MKIVYAFSVALALTRGAMMPSFAAAPLLTVAVQFAPNPPRRGPESITVHVQDAQGRPVNDATVRISTAMPAMSMTGPTVHAVPRGNGNYVTSLKLNFTTRWFFTVTAQSGRNSVKLVVQRDIR